MLKVKIVQTSSCLLPGPIYQSEASFSIMHSVVVPPSIKASHSWQATVLTCGGNKDKLTFSRRDCGRCRSGRCCRNMTLILFSTFSTAFSANLCGDVVLNGSNLGFCLIDPDGDVDDSLRNLLDKLFNFLSCPWTGRSWSWSRSSSLVGGGLTEIRYGHLDGGPCGAGEAHLRGVQSLQRSWW